MENNLFYIEHGSQKEVDGVTKVFDAMIYQWRNKSFDTSEEIHSFEMYQHWFSNNCHPNGYLKCPRCYRKHNVPDNFDLLCDGCEDILVSTPNLETYFTHASELKAWGIKPDLKLISERLTLRKLLDSVYKADSLYYKDRLVLIQKDLLDNKGNLSINYVQDSLEKPFVVNVTELIVS